MPDTDPAIVTKLDELLAAIRAYPDPRRASAEWKQAFNLLKKTHLNANTVANVVAMRGLDRLAELVDELRAPDLAEARDAALEADRPDDETCRAALKLFRRRLKMIRLDDESRIDSRDPLSKGNGSQIRAIEPPKEHSIKVWEELVRRGELKRAGKGFYELPGEPMQ